MVTIPPTIGAAMRFMTSDPVPELSMMGINPTMVDAPTHHAWGSVDKLTAIDGFDRHK